MRYEKIAKFELKGGRRRRWLTDFFLESIQNILAGLKLVMHSCTSMQHAFEHADYA